MTSPLTGKKLLNHIEKIIDDNKGIAPVILDLRRKSTVADYMLVVSGTSQRHVITLAQKLSSSLKGCVPYRIHTEGTDTGDWALIDAGDVVVHVFRPEVRDFYALEKMWSVDDDDATPARARRPRKKSAAPAKKSTAKKTTGSRRRAH